MCNERARHVQRFQIVYNECQSQVRHAVMWSLLLYFVRSQSALWWVTNNRADAVGITEVF